MSIKEMKETLRKTGFSVSQFKYVGKETFEDEKGTQYVVPAECKNIYIINNDSMHIIARK